ncbi:Ankyrin [Oopsacas minuta]|uniref:Ankyrin n=1 Tax=Oopsacas minuta TaxID=111878 RepID=A0AAV7JPG5_9METZ|nr:Ankyrin [Oopsacas minuta]
MTEYEDMTDTNANDRFSQDELDDQESLKIKYIYMDDKKIDELESLVEAGADYLDGHNTGESVLEKCVRLNRRTLYNTVLERYAKEKDEIMKSNFKFQIKRALLIAARTMNDEFINLILEQEGIDYNLFDIAENDGWKVLDKLNIQDFDQLNSANATMLHTSALKGQSTTVRYLLERGANPNILERCGGTPLTMALLGNDKDPQNDLTLSLLIENSDLSVPTLQDNMSILHLFAYEGNYEYIQRLIELGADPNVFDNDGNTPLCDAAALGLTLVVRALVKNGAKISMTDRYSKTALDKALEERNDETSAMLIRLNPDYNCIARYIHKYEEDYGIEKLIKTRQKKTLLALLDRSEAEYFWTEGDLRGGKLFWSVEEWQKGGILEALDRWDEEDLLYHGTIRILVDIKMRSFGFKYLALQMASYLLFLLALSYSLVQASTVGSPRDTYTQGAWNILRILSDLFVLAYCCHNVVTEGIEISRIMRNTHIYLKSKDNSESTVKKRKLRGKMYNIFCIRVLVDYFSNLSNVFDVLGLAMLFLLMILRIANQPVEWVFATIAFLLNAARLFKLIVLIPELGPYATIIFRILIHDVPLFLSLFLVNLLIFTGGYVIALRTPYTPEGVSNVSLFQDTTRTPGIDDGVKSVFLSGVRILLQGNVYEDDYLDTQLNWLAAIIYLAFLFLTVVVLLNVFIAQLSDRYAIVKERANQLYDRQKLRFIVQTETTSLLSAFDKCKQNYKVKDRELLPDDLLEYFHCSDLDIMNNEAINSLRDLKHYKQPSPIKYKKRNNEEVNEQVWDNKKEMENNIVRKFEESNMALDQKFEQKLQNNENLLKLALEKLNAIEEKLSKL